MGGRVSKWVYVQLLLYRIPDKVVAVVVVAEHEEAVIKWTTKYRDTEGGTVSFNENELNLPFLRPSSLLLWLDLSIPPTTTVSLYLSIMRHWRSAAKRRWMGTTVTFCGLIILSYSHLWTNYIKRSLVCHLDSCPPPFQDYLDNGQSMQSLSMLQYNSVCDPWASVPIKALGSGNWIERVVFIHFTIPN